MNTDHDLHGNILTVEHEQGRWFSWTLDTEDGSGSHSGTLVASSYETAVSMAKYEACEALHICEDCGTPLDDDARCMECEMARLDCHKD